MPQETQHSTCKNCGRPIEREYTGHWSGWHHLNSNKQTITYCENVDRVAGDWELKGTKAEPVKEAEALSVGDLAVLTHHEANERYPDRVGELKEGEYALVYNGTIALCIAEAGFIPAGLDPDTPNVVNILNGAGAYTADARCKKVTRLEAFSKALSLMGPVSLPLPFVEAESLVESPSPLKTYEVAWTLPFPKIYTVEADSPLNALIKAFGDRDTTLENHGTKSHWCKEFTYIGTSTWDKIVWDKYEGKDEGGGALIESWYVREKKSE